MDFGQMMFIELVKATIFTFKLLFGVLLPALVELVVWFVSLLQPRPSVAQDAAEVLRINPVMLAPEDVDEEMTPEELFQGGVVLGQDMRSRRG